MSSDPSATTTLLAHCHCRSFTYEIPLPVSPPPRLLSALCHCTRCRHYTGTLFTTWLCMQRSTHSFPSLSTSSTDFTPWKFSPHCTIYFCPTCGADCFAEMKEPQLWGLCSGMVSAWKGLDVKRLSEYMGSEHTGDGGAGVWMDGAKDMKWFGDGYQGTEMREVQMKEWKEETKEKVKLLEEEAKEGEERLEFNCACGGIEGYVVRPSKKQEQGSAFPDMSGKVSVPWLERLKSADRHPKYVGGVCSCTSCRVTSGWECFAWVYVPLENIFIHGKRMKFDGNGPPTTDVTTPIKHYQSRSDVWRSFCGTCGAKVFYTRITRPTEPAFVVDLAAGLFKSDVGARAEDWVIWKPDVDFEGEATDLKFTRAMNQGMEEWVRECRGL